MKTLFRSVIVLFLISQTTEIYSQEKGDFNASLDFVYGGGIGSNGGVNFGLEYLFSEKISVAPSYTYYFNQALNYNEYNIDGRYYFSIGEMKIYALAGYGLLTLKGELPVRGEVDESDGSFNIGAGANFPMSDRLSLNVQLKYADSGAGQAFLQSGFVYTF